MLLEKALSSQPTITVTLADRSMLSQFPTHTSSWTNWDLLKIDTCWIKIYNIPIAELYLGEKNLSQHYLYATSQGVEFFWPFFLSRNVINSRVTTSKTQREGKPWEESKAGKWQCLLEHYKPLCGLHLICKWLKCFGFPHSKHDIRSSFESDFIQLLFSDSNCDSVLCFIVFISYTSQVGIHSSFVKRSLDFFFFLFMYVNEVHMRTVNSNTTEFSSLKQFLQYFRCNP